MAARSLCRPWMPAARLYPRAPRPPSAAVHAQVLKRSPREAYAARSPRPSPSLSARFGSKRPVSAHMLACDRRPISARSIAERPDSGPAIRRNVAVPPRLLAEDDSAPNPPPLPLSQQPLAPLAPSATLPPALPPHHARGSVSLGGRAMDDWEGGGGGGGGAAAAAAGDVAAADPSGGGGGATFLTEPPPHMGLGAAPDTATAPLPPRPPAAPSQPRAAPTPRAYPRPALEQRAAAACTAAAAAGRAAAQEES